VIVEKRVAAATRAHHRGSAVPAVLPRGLVRAAVLSVMAETVHQARQAPQPLHILRSTSGIGIPPPRKRKRMARLEQESPQLKQLIFLNVIHLCVMAALSNQGVLPWCARTKARGRQEETHLPQKVHSPRVKSISGRPSLPRTMIPVGHALAHASQRVQAATKSASSHDQGGRIGSLTA